MKVKVKEGEAQSIIPGLIVTIVFFCFGLYAIGATLITILDSYGTSEVLESLMGSAIILFFGLLFFALSLLFIWYLIKPPACYLGVLVSKQDEIYKGKRIWNCKFNIKGKTKSPMRDYNCYTEYTNDWDIKGEYVLKIKEFNWVVKEVDIFDSSKYNEKKLKHEEIKSDNPFAIVAYGIIFIFGGIFTLSFINVAHDIYLGESPFADMVGMIPCFMFVALAYYILKVSNYSFMPLNEKIEYDREQGMKKLKKANFLMKDSEFNATEDIDLSHIKNFKVVRRPNNDLENFAIVDENDNVLYNIIDTNKHNKYIIRNKIDCQIGNLKIKYSSDSFEFLIKTINSEPYYMCFKKEKKYVHQIVGRDYKVKELKNKNGFIIVNKEEKDVACVILESNNSFPKALVELSALVDNDVYMISLGMLMAHYYMRKK